MTPTPDEIHRKLAAHFAADVVGWKAQAVKGSRALAVPYIDARDVQDRLDEVLTVSGWQDEYTVLEGGAVVCRLSLKIDGQWVTKMDVGAPSEQPDGGDRTKAAFSDALKRAAVKWGIGRYLYRFPSIWADYDPQRKQFVRTPTLPANARPIPARPDETPQPEGNYPAAPADKPPKHQDVRPGEKAVGVPLTVGDAAEKAREAKFLKDADALLAGPVHMNGLENVWRINFGAPDKWKTFTPKQQIALIDIRDKHKKRLGWKAAEVPA